MRSQQLVEEGFDAVLTRKQSPANETIAAGEKMLAESASATISTA
jgi:hypothetical protein